MAENHQALPIQTASTSAQSNSVGEDVPILKSLRNEELHPASQTTSEDDTNLLALDLNLDENNDNLLDYDVGAGDIGEIDTILDLAKAYIDMEDKDSAVNALNEVLSTGNDDQKAEAKALLKQLSGA